MNQQAKYIWESKTNWFGVLTALAGSITIISEYIKSGDMSLPGWMMVVVGIINVILRTFYTKAPVI